jgi:hypothetical protein
VLCRFADDARSHDLVMNVTRTATWVTVCRLSKRAAVVKSGRLLLLLAVAGGACDRSSPSSTPTSPGSPESTAVNLAGTWTGSIADNGGAANDVTLRLSQTDDPASGTKKITGTINWIGATTAVGTFAGTLSGKDLFFRINIPVGGFISPPSSRFCGAVLNGVTAGAVTATEFSGAYTGTNTCSGLVPLPGALQVHR